MNYQQIALCSTIPFALPMLILSVTAQASSDAIVKIRSGESPSTTVTVDKFEPLLDPLPWIVVATERFRLGLYCVAAMEHLGGLVADLSFQPFAQHDMKAPVMCGLTACLYPFFLDLDTDANRLRAYTGSVALSGGISGHQNSRARNKHVLNTLSERVLP